MKKSVIAASLCLLLGTPVFASSTPETPPCSRPGEFPELERALDWLAEQAKKREATREQYEFVASVIIARAREVYTDQELDAFVSDLVRSLDRALDLLAEKARDRNATAKDYQRVVDILVERARMIASGN